MTPAVEARTAPSGKEATEDGHLALPAGTLSSALASPQGSSVKLGTLYGPEFCWLKSYHMIKLPLRVLYGSYMIEFACGLQGCFLLLLPLLGRP